MNIKSIRRSVFLLPLLAVLSACLGGGDNPAIKYYLLDPVKSESLLAEKTDLSLDIIDLQVPQYLERFHMATREAENQLVYSEYHQWGESLRKNLLRTLARNLSSQLSTAEISTPLNRLAAKPDLRLQVHIEAFEQASDGRVFLAARWQVTTNDRSVSIPVQSLELHGTSVITAGDYAAMVGEMRELFAQLCAQIAQSLVNAMAS